MDPTRRPPQQPAAADCRSDTGAARGARLRARWRRLTMGLATVLGLKRLGFFIPYRYAGMIPRGREAPAYPAVETVLAAANGRFDEILAHMDRFAAGLKGIDGGPPPAPRWRQDWFPPLDAAVAYALVRGLAPARIVEVGAGHSTRFLARAIANGGLSCRFTAIDPAPRADLAGLAVHWISTTVQAAGPAPFADLGPGDILSIDSSHVLMPGTDVDVLLNRVLPQLPPDCVVHIHDVFLPDDYPAEWGWRGYNEQQAIAVLLVSGGWQPLWSSRFMATRRRNDIAGHPLLGPMLLQGVEGSSLWLRKSAVHWAR